MPQRYEILRKRGKGKRKKFRDRRNSMSYAHPTIKIFLEACNYGFILDKKSCPKGSFLIMELKILFILWKFFLF
jgi:hypothetical protein